MPFGNYTRVKQSGNVRFETKLRQMLNIKCREDRHTNNKVLNHLEMSIMEAAIPSITSIGPDMASEWLLQDLQRARQRQMTSRSSKKQIQRLKNSVKNKEC